MLENLRMTPKMVGIRQCTKAIMSGNAKTVLVAKDAAERVIFDIEKLCREHNLEITYTQDMKQLGKLCGIEVGASVACTLKA